MKKIVYVLGMICLSLILIATIFKVSHFQGANILLLVGLGTITLLFLPISYSKLLKSTDDKLLRFVYTAAFISFSIDFIGMVFKILHWPGAGILLIIGIPLPFILFLPAYVKYHNKRKLKTDINFFAVVLFMIYLGIFSSLLAMDVSRNVLDAYAHSANNITETNRYLKNHLVKNNIPSTEAEKLVKQLEGIKEELVLIGTARTGQTVYSDNGVDYFNVSSKISKLSYRTLANIGLYDFNQQFESYCQKLPQSDNINRLLDEINIYRLAKSENNAPIICQLRLIGILNILTDWQNKILLIEYIRSEKTKMLPGKTGVVKANNAATL